MIKEMIKKLYEVGLSDKEYSFLIGYLRGCMVRYEEALQRIVDSNSHTPEWFIAKDALKEIPNEDI